MAMTAGFATSALHAQPVPAVTVDVSDAALAARLGDFSSTTAQINGIRLHYVIGGKGPLLVLLPGWPETWWEWHKIMPELARTHRVVAVDLRGMGGSDKPESGYDKKTMAADIGALIRSLGADKADVAGHDIGSMVAFSLAATRPDLVRKLVLVDVAPPDNSLKSWPMLPGVGTFGDKVGDGSTAYVWWFAFHQVKGLPEQLLADGRIRYAQDWFFHYLTRDEASIDALDRAVYQSAYTSKDAIRAGDAWYQAFPQDIVDDESYSKLAMPVLAVGGPGYGWLKSVLSARTSDLRVVKSDVGHFIPEEDPQFLASQMRSFLK
ncbi:alpha/beta fold hydrolase [Novosphingobium terrae]|uniref:alpha/beta fold hydrolase n=1 Tax=Novosphingobium terrae TaxID=2726189 RepID=UPI001F13EF1E|nr:alpha/beta hydrolase [Novosphingobium terrae]